MKGEIFKHTHHTINLAQFRTICSVRSTVNAILIQSTCQALDAQL